MHCVTHHIWIPYGVDDWETLPEHVQYINLGPKSNMSCIVYKQTLMIDLSMYTVLNIVSQLNYSHIICICILSENEINDHKQ